MTYLIPILILLSIPFRGLANILLLISSILGCTIIFSKRINYADIVWFIFIVLEILVMIIGKYNPTSLKSFYIESKYLFIYPAGLFIKYICQKYCNFFSYKFYKILIILLGLYLVSFSGLEPRFGGAYLIPLLGDVWPPTVSLTYLFVIMQGNFPIKNFKNSLIIGLFIISSILSNSIAIALVYVKNTLEDFKKIIFKLKIKKSLIIFLTAIPLVFFYLISIYLWRRKSLDFSSFDFLLTIDRTAFYFSYFQTYLNPFFDINNLVKLFFGNGIGTSVTDWIENLPVIFIGPNMNFTDFSDSAQIFQIEFLRIIYTYGIFGLIFIIILFKEVISNKNMVKSKKSILELFNFKDTLINPNLLLSLIIISILTITFSTSSNYLTFLFTIFSNPFNKISNQKYLKQK